MLHDITDLHWRQAIARGVVRRSQQQHTGVYTVGIRNYLIDIVGKGVVLLIQGVHFEGAATLAGHTVVIPPGELGDKDALVVIKHEEIVNGILQHVLTAIGEQHLLLGNTIDFTQAYRDHTLFALIIDAGIEA